MTTGSSTVEQTQWRTTGGNKPVCSKVTKNFSATNSLSAPSSDVRSATLKGNRVTALPYSRLIMEPVELSGMMKWTRSDGSAKPECASIGARDAGSATGNFSPAVLCNLPSKPAMIVAPGSWAPIIAIAETKALSNARKSFNNVPLLVAERRETVAMIGKRLEILSKGVGSAQAESLQKYRRAKKRDRPSVARDAASWHLELLFGWLPLIDEVEGALELLASESTIDFYGRGAQAKVTEERTTPNYVLSQFNVGTYVVQAPLMRFEEHYVKQSAYVSLRYRVTVGGFKRARELGFNPLSATFDLIPLSFLLNFISNTGQWLKSYDPLIGATFVTGSCSTMLNEAYRQRRDGMYTVLNGGASRLSCTGTVTAIRSGKLFNRAVYVNEPTGSWHFQNNLTLAKAASAISLALQRYIKPLRSLMKVKQFRYRGPRPKYLPPIRYRKQ